MLIHSDSELHVTIYKNTCFDGYPLAACSYFAVDDVRHSTYN
jgi:hypothetical protein